MKRFFFLMTTLLAALLFAACSEEEKGCYPPVYLGFAYEPAIVHPGDSVTITAVQGKKGKLLNGTDYQLTLRVSIERDGMAIDSTLTARYHTNYDGLSNRNPVFGFVIPRNANARMANCSFSARWSNSADGVGGSFGGQNNAPYKGAITSYSYTIYSEARGSFQLPIAQ